jgi:hypothetical protein
MARLWKSLAVSNMDAFILRALLIALMAFPTLGGAFYTVTAHECTNS